MQKYHGVQVRTKESSWEEESFQAAFNNLFTQEEIPGGTQIRTYLWSPRKRNLLFVLKGTQKCQLWINNQKLFNKQPVIPGAGFLEVPSGFFQITVKYQKEEHQEGEPLKIPELRWSNDFVSSTRVLKEDTYLQEISAQKILWEHLGRAAGIIFRLDLFLIGLYLVYRSFRAGPDQNQQHQVNWPSVALFSLMFLLCLIGYRYQMEEAIHPDERLVDGMIQQVESGSLELKQFWYTTGYVYLCAALEEVVSWIVHSELPLHMIQHAVSVLASILSCLVVYFIGRELFSKTVALLAAALFGFSFLPVYLAHFGIIEPFLVFLFLSALLSIIQLQKRWNKMSFAKAGLLAGLVIGTKQTGFIIFIPFLVGMLWLFKRKVLNKFGITEMATYLLSAFTGYFLLAPYTIIRFGKFYDYQMKQLLKLEGTTNVRFFASTAYSSFGSIGVLIQNLIDGVGLPLLIAAIFGAILLFRKSLFAATILIPISVIYFVITAEVAVVPFHYALLLCPLLALCAAYAIEFVSGFAGHYRGPVMAGLTIGLLISSALKIWSFERVLQGEDTRRVAATWCYKNLPPGVRIDFELFGPRFLIPMFDSTTVPPFKRKPWPVYYLKRLPQYYVEDSITSEIFESPDPKSFPVEKEWLRAIRKKSQLVFEKKGDGHWLLNPAIRIYKIPEAETNH
jgi:hypothetical protein